jgi:DNA-binding transcriptional ArsR family regulator
MYSIGDMDMVAHPTEMSNQQDETHGYMRYCIFQACAIDDVEVSAECLRVLAALGSYASRRNDYWCWTSLDKMARRMGVTPPAISVHVNKLAELGYIELMHDYTPSGKQMSNAYRLIMDYVLPTERQRCMHDRPRAGIGGRKKSGAAESIGLTQPVKDRVNSELSIGLTQPVKDRVNSELSIGLTQPVKQIWESESEKLRNREVNQPSFISQNQKTETAARPHALAATIAAAIPDSDLTPAVAVWVRAQEAIKRSMTQEQYQTNLRGAQLFTDTRDHWRYVLIATSPYTAEQLRTRFYDRVRGAIESVARGPFAGLEVRPAV